MCSSFWAFRDGRVHTPSLRVCVCSRFSDQRFMNDSQSGFYRLTTDPFQQASNDRGGGETRSFWGFRLRFLFSRCRKNSMVYRDVIIIRERKKERERERERKGVRNMKNDIKIIYLKQMYVLQLIQMIFVVLYIRV